MITVLQVDVKGNAKIKESFLGQTWVYALSVQKNKTECYTIYKKWNEIYDLHNRLAKDYPSSMGYIIPAFPKSHFYESRKIAEERIADLRIYFIELLKCEFCRACLPLKDFLLANEHDETRHDLYCLEKHKERKDAQGRISVDIGAPVAANEYVLEADWDPTEFDPMKNLLPAMKQGDKVFVIDKTEAGWWLAAPSGQMDMQPGYIQASCIE